MPSLVAAGSTHKFESLTEIHARVLLRLWFTSDWNLTQETEEQSVVKPVRAANALVKHRAAQCDVTDCTRAPPERTRDETPKLVRESPGTPGLHPHHPVLSESSGQLAMAAAISPMQERRANLARGQVAFQRRIAIPGARGTTTNLAETRVKFKQLPVLSHERKACHGPSAIITEGRMAIPVPRQTRMTLLGWSTRTNRADERASQRQRTPISLLEVAKPPSGQPP
jgi:hypothetical protein